MSITSMEFDQTQIRQPSEKINSVDYIDNNENKSDFNLEKEIHNILVVFGMVTEIILSDNHLLEYVSFNDIYKILLCIFRARYEDILNGLQKNTVKNDEKYKEGKIENETPKGDERDLPQYNDSHKKKIENINKSKNNKVNDIYGDNELAKEIKLKFSQMFYGSPDKKTNGNSNNKNIMRLIPMNSLNYIKYAITGCIYLHGKISTRKLSLRHILNSLDFNLYILNNYMNTENSLTANSDLKTLAFIINQYQPIVKENIYNEKEESLKMEKASLCASSFNISNNIFKYSLLFELIFITRSPFIINKFIYSVFNDMLCIPNINNKYNDIVIVISCILFVNHFFYHLNHHHKMASPYFKLIKKMYMSQVEKIINIFILLNPTTYASEMKNVISLVKEIANLYSITY
ncbi:hypothetical protein YYC_04650 [Plasmodium yoelii 17X]|uniref:Uncharacterized protein n=3 Tax=Plasmodium yoelii TaxID=5861 RepID=A0AAE9WNU0_PLAYO|nr:conserved Plasmodium protein, unknown function [Plasmodium yoelii]ETB57849.1 hypothetical protein YYC_04650 [Plasmodium yoelii 17X]WBY57487.1 hypothetical protein Py17XNL_000900367 [Plasmodium yoelii yoelii]CDU18124.1 conserved Plasmodium protein, unknown function [Plasmodium yoelii]VTZ78541.1 conserved Plasmodium protein, unknown function [Plasmodium yoelii]|eukprot:XP_726488.2 conserved Plasmodium protein, unknown function [Plasmodium yoelii]